MPLGTESPLRRHWRILIPSIQAPVDPRGWFKDILHVTKPSRQDRSTTHSIQLHNVYNVYHPTRSLDSFCTHRLLLRLVVALAGNEGLALDGTELPVRHDLLWPQLDGGNVGGLVGDLLHEFLQ